MRTAAGLQGASTWSAIAWSSTCLLTWCAILVIAGIDGPPDAQAWFAVVACAGYTTWLLTWSGFLCRISTRAWLIVVGGSVAAAFPMMRALHSSVGASPLRDGVLASAILALATVSTAMVAERISRDPMPLALKLLLVGLAFRLWFEVSYFISSSAVPDDVRSFLPLWTFPRHHGLTDKSIFARAVFHWSIALLGIATTSPARLSGECHHGEPKQI